MEKQLHQMHTLNRKTPFKFSASHDAIMHGITHEMEQTHSFLRAEEVVFLFLF